MNPDCQRSFVIDRTFRGGINHPTQSKVMLDRIPIGRFAEPEEMARPILWMCSDDASYLSGHLMIVDGAMTAGLPEPGELEAPMPGSVR